MNKGSECDVLVAGSGIAGLVAALTAAEAGAKVRVIEKAAVIGGTSSSSEAMVWVPLSRQARAAGIDDDRARATSYLEGLAGPLANVARIAAYVDRAAEALAFVEDNSAVRYTLSTGSRDYYADVAGATAGARALDVGAFDARRLGSGFAQIRRPLDTMLAFGGMTIPGFEAGHFYRVLRSPRSFGVAARTVARYALDRARGRRRGTRIGNGQGVVAALVHRLGELGVEVETGTALTELIWDDDRVTGARTGNGTIAARGGVVLATGGFGASAAIARRFTPGLAANHVSLAPAENTGDGLTAAGALGARVVDALHAPAAWTPVSRVPLPGGGASLWPHFGDRAKPGVIAVARDARRFVNEGVPYVDFVPAMMRTCAPGEHCEVYLIADRRALRRYGFGAVPPAPLSYRPYVRSGYLIEAGDVGALANALNLDADTLTATIARFNADAATGRDHEFGKGDDPYSRNNGDAGHRPNPCLAPLRPPFYAIRVEPGDLATFAGLDTDGEARVLNEGGRPIPGLYAAGNDAATVMGGAYAGAGIAVGHCVTFGYLAGRAAARGNDQTSRSPPSITSSAPVM